MFSTRRKKRRGAKTHTESDGKRFEKPLTEQKARVLELGELFRFFRKQSGERLRGRWRRTADDDSGVEALATPLQFR